MSATIARVRKSVRLEAAERRKFEKWVSQQPTKIDAAATIGVNRMTLDRILAVGSGSEENIAKIRNIISQ